jgi:hypothetical protein
MTQGIQNSCKGMRMINGLKKHYNLSRDIEDCIYRYKIIFKTVIKEAKEEQMISMF